MKTICIYHSRDLDGWMSAAIVKKWFIEKNPNNNIINNLDDSEPVSRTFDRTITTNYPELHFMGWDHGDDIPDLSESDKVIMVDVAFSKEAMSCLFENFDINFIWIDHHISAIKDALGETAIVEHEDTTTLYNGLSRTDYAACELTWQYFFPDKEMPEIVRLLGRYDCFGHKGTDEEQKVLEFQYAARAYINDYETAYKYLDESINKTKGKVRIESEMLLQGKTIYKYLCTEAAQTYKKAFPVEFKIEAYTSDVSGNNKEDVSKTYKFLCVNQERFNPVNFGIDYHKDGYDGFACFWLKSGKWHWSLYNDNGNVDCSVIAKQYDGGGHKGAAGMVIEDLSMIF